MKYLLFLENDVSLDTGEGINERESLRALLDICGDQLIAVLPEPARPGVLRDSRIRYVPSHCRYKPLHYVRFTWASWRMIRAAVRSENVGAVIHRPGISLIVPYLLVRSGIPVILKTMAQFGHLTKSGRSWQKRIADAAYRLLATRCFPRCLGGDTVSELYLEWFCHNYGMQSDRLVAIFNGANTDAFRPIDRLACQQFLGVTRFKTIVGYVGAIHEMRSLETVIRSLTHLADVPELGIVLVGDGPARRQLEMLAQQLGVAERVVFRSAVPYEDMPQVINAFDVAIDLTKVDVRIGTRLQFASFSQKISQYLACAIPTIAWDTADTRFLSEYGLGVTPSEFTPNAIASAIRQIITSQHFDRLQIRTYCEEHLSTIAAARKRFALWQRLIDRRANSKTSGNTQKAFLCDRRAA